MPFVIGDPCLDVSDKSCVDECPVDCIYEGDRKLYVNPLECIDCGNCAPACPVGAIFTDREIPEDQQRHVVDNAEFFSLPLPGREQPLGMPGGASAVGRVGVDTPGVQATVGG